MWLCAYIAKLTFKCSTLSKGCFRMRSCFRKRSECQKCSVRMLLSEQRCQDYFSEIKQVNPAMHWWSINWANGNMGKTARFKRLTHLPRVRMFEDYIRELNFIYEVNNYLWHSWEKLERETKKIFKHSKLPRKEKEHLTHWVIFSSTYLVLFVVKSLRVIRALIVLKCVTLSVLWENLVCKIL